jgi:hypothetical protein
MNDVVLPATTVEGVTAVEYDEIVRAEAGGARETTTEVVIAAATAAVANQRFCVRAIVAPLPVRTGCCSAST